jgi:dipeptidyl aminopeptidase/acylaminoacyl peptidase
MISAKSVDVVERWVGSLTNLVLFVMMGFGLVCGGWSCQAQEITGMKLSDVSFVSELDKTVQKYVVLESDGFRRSNKKTLLVALHGHGADRWQYVREERDECRATREFAMKYGMLMISPDYRARTSWMGPAAEADLKQILAEVRELYAVEGIIVSGGSMGGTSALIFGALHPDIVDGIVAMNPTSNMEEYGQFQEAIAESYGGSKAEVPEEYRKRSSELQFERLTMPVAVTTGGKDTLVPPESTLRLVEKLRGADRKVFLKHRSEGGHATAYEDGMQALEFVAEALSLKGIDK